MSTVELGLGPGLSVRPRHKPASHLWCRAEQGFLSSWTWASCPFTAISRWISPSTSIPKNSVRCTIYLLHNLRHIFFLRRPWPGVMLQKRPLNYFCCPCQPLSTSVKWGFPFTGLIPLGDLIPLTRSNSRLALLQFVFPSPPCSLPVMVGALSLLVWLHYLSLINYLPSM